MVSLKTENITLVECPRDAMQGWEHFIPTHKKIEYINQLLKVGFDVIDFGSFVSPKAIPQLADTARVLDGLHLNNDGTKLLAIVANLRGAQSAMTYPQIDFIGYPFSVSPTFQLRNTNSSMEQAWQNVLDMKELCMQNKKQLVVYLSMGFGNPYGDAWSPELVLEWAKKMDDAGVHIISVADTVGLASEQQVAEVFSALGTENFTASYGIHLHSSPYNWRTKVSAAFSNGCKRYDSTIKGYGGCPFAEDDLVGNIATENLVLFLNEQNVSTKLNSTEFAKAMELSSFTFV